MLLFPLHRKAASSAQMGEGEILARTLICQANHHKHFWHSIYISLWILMNQTNELARTWFISFQTAAHRSLTLSVTVLLCWLCYSLFVFFFSCISASLRLNPHRYDFYFSHSICTRNKTTTINILYSLLISHCAPITFIRWNRHRNKFSTRCKLLKCTNTHFRHIDISDMYVFTKYRKQHFQVKSKTVSRKWNFLFELKSWKLFVLFLIAFADRLCYSVPLTLAISLCVALFRWIC